MKENKRKRKRGKEREKERDLDSKESQRALYDIYPIVNIKFNESGISYYLMYCLAFDIGVRKNDIRVKNYFLYDIPKRLSEHKI